MSFDKVSEGDNNVYIYFQFEEDLAIEIGDNFAGISVYNMEEQRRQGFDVIMDVTIDNHYRFIKYVFGWFEKDYEEYK